MTRSDHDWCAPLKNTTKWETLLVTLFSIYRFALDNGYRHIDCAKVYLNEKEVGEIFEEYIDKKIPRKDLFIVGKVSF